MRSVLPTGKTYRGRSRPLGVRTANRSSSGAIIAGVIVIALAGIGVFAVANIVAPPPTEVAQPAEIEPPAIISPGPVEGAVGIDPGIDADITAELLSGSFVDGDAIHRGSGTVAVVDDGERFLLVFGDDVSITPGPDLFVYLSPNAPGEDLGEFVSLGVLAATDGAQVYVMPENIEGFRTVVVWCRAFGVAFATAELS